MTHPGERVQIDVKYVQRKCLTEEEFKELEESIREIKVAGQAAPFHNVKLS